MKVLRHPRILVPAGILILAALFFRLSQWRASGSAEPQLVSVQRVALQPLAQKVVATGTTEPADRVDVKSRVSGAIEEVNVTEGQTIAAGDLLGRFSAPAFQAQLAQAEAAARQAEISERQVQRQADSWAEQVAAQLAQATARLTIAKATAAQQTSQAAITLADALAGLETTKQTLEGTKLTEDDVAAAEAQLELAILHRREVLNIDSSTAEVRERADMQVQTAQANYDRTKAKFGVQADAIAKQLQQAQQRVDQAAAELARVTTDETSPALAQITEAQAALTLAGINADVTRVDSLDVERAQAAAWAAAAAYQQALRDYKSPDITSPGAGRVLAVNATQGDMVAPGISLFVLGRTDDLVVKAQIDEVDIGKVAVGDTTAVTSSAFVNKTFEGTVTKLAPQAVRQGNIAVFIAEITIHNPDDLLKPGMNVDVAITSEQKKAVLAVPIEALQDWGTDKVVFVFAGGAVHRRSVTVGITTQTQVEIVSGLKEGDQVVTGPSEVLSKLKDGDPVKVKS